MKYNNNNNIKKKQQQQHILYTNPRRAEKSHIIYDLVVYFIKYLQTKLDRADKKAIHKKAMTRYTASSEISERSILNLNAIAYT